MDRLELIKQLKIPAETKILLVVLDGLGGLPLTPDGKTELEQANTPNLDALAQISELGLSVPILPGITPGSGPGHLGLFGYDPLKTQIGRGVLEALGIGFDLTQKDVAARGNFCSLDPETGFITDRRAGRIPTEKCVELVGMLKDISLPGVEVFIEPVKDYRFVLVLRGDDLHDGLTETDPQLVGVPPLPVEPTRPEAKATADLFNKWLNQASNILADQRPANGANLRGLAKTPDLPLYQEVFGLKAGAIATYPMYRGVARLVGMEVLPAGETIASEVETLAENWSDYDFFFFHVKKTDSAGEDGDFEAKAKVIEEFDAVLPDIMALNPDVILITGDHSTPALWKSHSWHPLPVLLNSKYIRPDSSREFGERACAAGSLGHISHMDLMPLAMANAGRLTKFGA
ncbi:MAG: 2,3-bisphosphoglycerate-independent phosphoglycerate mutase [Deltaproteobacteria bacterium]|nr:2,3-bisphosphoglycerate-independent phosphoglycerate mutase [Deltaproteobacteria bacterium]MBW2051261.1 2,3-bisphosphoglycerate-independent phosphoglycerate mutase [Deltaproteobacteria bacterium]MBW2142232.1 2,3-bisphosphoglycerate-independent phosphoglycerate mutase [Deltaproteobacteria bacterium]MBW2324064.1 2,3-bisphosphoglycerate-independent phosphoglycerate mutase [Deltaproteobacteria bacterium]